MIINKCYKFRLYPNDEQRILINKTIGCSRLVYNLSLGEKKSHPNMKRFNLNGLLPFYKEEYPFLKEVDSTALQNAIVDLINGFEKYYNKQGGYPNFKKRGSKNSYRTNCIRSTYKGKKYQNISIDLKNKKIILPKLKKVKIRGYRNLLELPGIIKNATITNEGNKYYVSVCVEEEIIEKEKREVTAVGIDIGVKSLVTTNEGITYENKKYIKKYEKKIEGLQKSLSRKTRGSNNYNKIKEKLNDAYRKLRNARKKYAEYVVSEIIEYNDIIITEDLRVKEMTLKGNNKKQLRKLIIDATFNQIIRIIEYKCKWLNKTLIKVNPYYASSQICSRCGKKEKSMKDIRKREYECKECGNKMDRDLNASINIYYEGITKYYKEKYC